MHYYILHQPICARATERRSRHAALGRARLALTTVLDGDRLGGRTTLRSHAFHLLHHIHALDDRSKHDMLSVKPGGLCRTQKELRSVCILSSIGHRQNTRSGVFQCEVLISELLAVDRLATGTVALGEVAALTHEARNDAVKLASLEAEAFLTGTQRTEVLSGLRYNITSQLHNDTSGRLAADVDIEEATASHAAD